METVQEGGQAVSVEQKILFLSESPNCHQSRELRLIALEVRKREDRIKQLEQMYEGIPGERPDLLGTNVMGLLTREIIGTQKRIKRMEEVGDEMARWLSSSRNLGDDPFLSHKWRKAKEDK
jgi:hypothetical protein